VPREEMLVGIIEADEAYFLKSFKGRRGWKRRRLLTG
jgi:hypothetical protein